MVKSMSLRLAFLLLLISIAGCAGGSGLKSESSESEAPQKPRITLAVTSSADTKTIGDLIEEFNEAHANFQVDLMSLPSDRYDETLNLLMTSGEGPDVFQLGTGWLTSYIYKNWLLDLSEAADDRIRQSFPDWAADYTKQNDHYYAIPSGLVTTRLIYNRDLLDSAGCRPNPPSTWPELRECADKISQAGAGYRKYGFALAAGEDQAGFQQPLETASTYSGVNYYDFAEGKYDFSVYEPWFQTMLAMKKDGGLFPGELTLKSDTALTQFAQGNVGMMIVTNRDFTLLSRMEPFPFQLGIADPPVLEAADKGKGVLKIDPEPPFVINAYSANPQEATELWEYLHSPDYLGALYKAGDTIPTLVNVRNDPKYIPPQTDFAAFLPNEEDSPYPQEPKFILQNIPSPYSPKNLGDNVRMKAYRDILQEIRPAQEALRDLTEQYNKSLEDAIYKKLINMNDYVFPSFDPLHPLKRKSIDIQMLK